METIEVKSIKEVLKQKFKYEIECILGCIKEITKYKIYDIKYTDSYLDIISEQDNAVCKFKIKQIPGFEFILLSTSILSSKQLEELNISSNSSWILFCGTMKNITGIPLHDSVFKCDMTIEKLEDKQEEDYLLRHIEPAEFAAMIKYIKRNKTKSLIYTVNGIDKIWLRIPYLKCVKIYISAIRDLKKRKKAYTKD